MNNKLCRISKLPLSKVLDFGMQPLGNGFIDASSVKDEYFFPMEVGFCQESMMLQLIEQPDPKKMFHDQYAFYSSTSRYMQEHFKKFSNQVLNFGCLDSKDPFVIELGCNDGIMLKNFAERNIRHLGIEPSENVAAVANKHGIRTISKFFSEELAEFIIAKDGQADAFIAANVMCHIPDIVDVVKGIKKLLKPKGVVMFEDPYLGDIVEKISYDQIYDEHVFLFSALSVQYLFNLYGLELIDVQHQDVHGGSMRYIIGHKGAYPVLNSVSTVIAAEKLQGLHLLSTYQDFAQKVAESKSTLISLLKTLKKEGVTVVGYAATSKSTTILNYCGIGPDLIEYICDTTPIKVGKFSPGAHIPIVSHEKFKEAYPNFAFLFAWNHATEIIANESGFLSSGGRWITHVPNVRILQC
jgi:methylation protein EvaC